MDELLNLVFTKLYVVNILFFIAVVAFQDSFLLVDDVEDGLHGLVVGDALGVVALHDAAQFVGSLDGFLFHHLVVADDVEHDFGCHNAEPRDFFLGKELVCNLDDALASDFLPIFFEGRL